MKQQSLAVIIMAAGQGKRMRNPDLAKVMHPLDGVPLVERVVSLARNLSPDRIVVVVGHQREQVISHLAAVAPDVSIAVQAEQLGTAHAVLQTRAALGGFDGDVVILSGDAPLTRAETLSRAIELHRSQASVATVLTAVLDDATGYGRVIRGGDGSVERIVEHKDATEVERRIREINSGMYVFSSGPLFQALGRVDNHNAQGEYYLPDVFALLLRDRHRVHAFTVEDADEIRGVNTIEQLEEMHRILAARPHSPLHSSQEQRTN